MYSKKYELDKIIKYTNDAAQKNGSILGVFSVALILILFFHPTPLTSTLVWVLIAGTTISLRSAVKEYSEYYKWVEYEKEVIEFEESLKNEMPKEEREPLLSYEHFGIEPKEVNNKTANPTNDQGKGKVISLHNKDKS